MLFLARARLRVRALCIVVGHAVTSCVLRSFSRHVCQTKEEDWDTDPQWNAQVPESAIVAEDTAEVKTGNRPHSRHSADEHLGDSCVTAASPSSGDSKTLAEATSDSEPQATPMSPPKSTHLPKVVIDAEAYGMSAPMHAVCG